MSSPAADPPASPPPRSRLRFELIFASAWLAFGLFLLPALIYGVGTSLLGPYGEKAASLGRFYADFFGDLAEPSGRAWSIALGPLVLICLIRLVFVGVPQRRKDDADTDRAPHQEKPAAAREHSRVEPHVGLD